MKLRAFAPLMALTTLLFSVTQAQVYKAQLRTSSGQFVGFRQIRDLKLCGTRVGPSIIAETVDVRGERLQQEGKFPKGEQVWFVCVNDKRLNSWVTQPWPGSEVRTLVEQGPFKNRIDLTIVGDGYTTQEKDKFFQDADAIVKDLFGDQTFATYRALFNVHAVYVPSQESGLGDGRPKRTALGLYRHPAIRQAVMASNDLMIHRALGLAPDTDYPILVANDRYYGGLGGAYAITTSAPLNRTTVLRHELGHNFGRVGEEYDGGQVYDGANFSYSANVPWAYFSKTSVMGTYEAQLLSYEAPWKNLKTGPYEVEIQFPKGHDFVEIDFSSLGFETEKDGVLRVDGKFVPFKGEYNYDRNFYLVRLPMTQGSHKISFEEGVSDTDNILSKVAIYAKRNDFPSDTDRIGAFATYDESGSRVGYRPTDRVCLMKDMKSHHFCSICTENMWRNFLREVHLIDEVRIQGDSVELATLPLGQSRLRVEWFNPSGKRREDLSNRLSWKRGPKDAGKWKVFVKFVSAEVQEPTSDAWTVHSKEFAIK